MRIINCYRCDPDNVGDRASTPNLYYPLNAEAIDSSNTELKADTVIFGGGGMLLDDWPYRVDCQYAIIWGVGDNRQGKISYPQLWQHYTLVGVRDWNKVMRFPWIPCASCKHWAIDKYKNTSPIHQAIVYEHHHRPLNLPLPTGKNNAPNVDTAMAFLASGETVVTNSYHGVYWALLLGRKVLLVDAWSNKFNGFRWNVARCDSRLAMKYLKYAKAYPESLEQCRAANDIFYEKVRGLIG